MPAEKCSWRGTRTQPGQVPATPHPQGALSRESSPHTVLPGQGARGQHRIAPGTTSLELVEPKFSLCRSWWLWTAPAGTPRGSLGLLLTSWPAAGEHCWPRSTHSPGGMFSAGSARRAAGWAAQVLEWMHLGTRQKR